MFIAVWKDENKNLQGGVYYSHELFYHDTFNPTIEIITIINFKIKGGTYAERKAYARELAIEWSNCEKPDFSWGEWCAIDYQFEKIGKRYGLLTEFRENCIC